MAEPLEEIHRALVRYQIDRLRRTYMDFLDQKGYAAVVPFFFEEVYSAKGKRERDEGFQVIYQKFGGKLGLSLTRNMKKLIDLNTLTDDLDHRMARKLHEMGLGPRFTEDEYEEAYYLTDAYEPRALQIRLIVECIRFFHGLAQYRSVGMTLTVIRPYALLRGARVLMDFLQHGYRACRSVESIDGFVEAIERRETERLDRIYSLGKRPPTIWELRRRAKELGIKGAERMNLRSMMREMQRWT